MKNNKGILELNSLLFISLLLIIDGDKEPKKILLYISRAYAADKITPEQASIPLSLVYWKADNKEKNSPMKLHVEGKDILANVSISTIVAKTGIEAVIPL